MSQANNNAKEQLLKLEKIVKKVIRKSLKNNTLEYTLQITMSSISPSKLKYACQITSPATGVKDIIYIFDTFEELEAALLQSEKEFNPTKVEAAFHESRINTYKNKIQQHEARLVVINDPNYGKEDEDIEMEEV